MPKCKWAVLVVGVIVATMLTSGAYAQQSGGNYSPIVTESFASHPASKKARQKPIGECHHRRGCRLCCFFPKTGNSSCVFDLEWCGQ